VSHIRTSPEDEVEKFDLDMVGVFELTFRGLRMPGRARSPHKRGEANFAEEAYPERTHRHSVRKNSVFGLGVHGFR
jgi:hypothetical protein